MISAEYYNTVYLIFVAILTLAVGEKYSRYGHMRYCATGQESSIPAIILTVAMTLFIGLRPVDGVFIDMVGYASQWDYWNLATFKFDWHAQNILFDNLRSFMSSAGMPIKWFFLLIAGIYFGNMCTACRKMFPNDTLFVLLMCLAAFSTFSYGTNGIKSGAAASIFLVALAYQDKLRVAIPMALISWGFHHSMMMVVIAFVVTRFIRSPRVYYALWIVSVLLAVFHITWFQEIFSGLSDEVGLSYLTNFDFRDGFRLDFVLYSAIPVLVGYFSVFRKNIKSRFYISLLNMYLLTNTVWLLCMYASFTNRIAYLSWFMYPVVLIYPFLKENWGIKQFHSAKLVSYAHMAFTLFMAFIYYK
ncbi:MAG: EpsG family protein [Bacteroidales bacterium]|nr:EpsG family protein [Bacteroidales bacterium]